MRETRIIAGIALFAAVFVLAGLLWALLRTNSSSIDLAASLRIDQICGFQRECKVQLSDLIAGDWDTFYEFGTSVPQSEVDHVLGIGRVNTGDRQRLLVLTRNGKIVSSQLEDDGVEMPLNHEVEFVDEHHRDQHWIAVPRDTWLHVHRFPTGLKGTYYVLSNATR